jgi:hypothetical protein
VDLIRSRAIPALIAALAAVPSAAAECSSLEGTYRFESSSPPVPGQPPFNLGELGMKMRPGDKIYEVEGGATAKAKAEPKSLNPSEPIRRLKSTLLASSATLKRTPSGTQLDIKDAKGIVLAANANLDAYTRWHCKDNRLERSSERMAGLGDSIRTERVEEVLERNAAGDLVHRQTITVLEPKGVKPTTRESVFPAVR